MKTWFMYNNEKFELTINSDESYTVTDLKGNYLSKSQYDNKFQQYAEIVWKNLRDK